MGKNKHNLNGKSEYLKPLPNKIVIKRYARKKCLACSHDYVSLGWWDHPQHTCSSLFQFLTPGVCDLKLFLDLLIKKNRIQEAYNLAKQMNKGIYNRWDGGKKYIDDTLIELNN